MLPSRHDNCEKKVVYLLIDIISFNVYCHRYYNNLRNCVPYFITGYREAIKMLLDSKTELLSLHQMIPEIVSFCNFEFLFCPLFRQSLLAKRKTSITNHVVINVSYLLKEINNNDLYVIEWDSRK